MRFAERVQSLPVLGLGVSTEYGAQDGAGALDPVALRTTHPEFAGFLEIGVETLKGLDRHARAWLGHGWPATYHFLDVNLDEPADLSRDWIAAVGQIAAQIRPAWLCGDAGLWHFGPRERGHMLLLPPILTADSAAALADGIIALREATGFEVFPENPPGASYLGNLHLLDFFAQVCERADTGMLLDCAHLAIYQRMLGHSSLTGLDGFPRERIVEMHVAGGVEGNHAGYRFVEDSHTVQVLPDTWEILEHLAPRVPNLRAVVFECERNPLAECLPGFARIWKLCEPHFARAQTPAHDSLEVP